MHRCLNYSVLCRTFKRRRLDELGHSHVLEGLKHDYGSGVLA